MQEEKVCNGLHHDAFGCCSSEAVHDASSNKTAMGLGRCLPNRGANRQSGEDQTRKTSTEDVGAGDDDEVGISQHNDRKSSEQTELLCVQVEGGSEQGEHWSH